MRVIKASSHSPSQIKFRVSFPSCSPMPRQPSQFRFWRVGTPQPLPRHHLPLRRILANPDERPPKPSGTAFWTPVRKAV